MATFVETLENGIAEAARLKDFVNNYMMLRDWVPPHVLSGAEITEMARYFGTTDGVIEKIYDQMVEKEIPVSVRKALESKGVIPEEYRPAAPTMPVEVPTLPVPRHPKNQVPVPANRAKTLVIEPGRALPVAALVTLLRRVWEEGVNHLLSGEAPEFVQALQELMLWAINQPDVVEALTKPSGDLATKHQ